jgi:hypothetical protein
MSAVDWEKAEQDYVSNRTLSYSDIAKKYSAVKSTVQRQATKRRWQQKRRMVSDHLADKYLERFKVSISEIEAQHHQIIRDRIDKAYRQMYLYNEKVLNDTVTHKDTMEFFAASNILFKSIKLERVMLGLPFRNISQPAIYRNHFEEMRDIKDQEEFERISKAAKRFDNLTPAEQIKQLKINIARFKKLRNNG